MPEFRSLDDVKQFLREYARVRDWEQFHAPKNLAMALAVEASELMEIFQWLTTDESHHLDGDQRQQVKEEIADVFMYLLRMSDVLDIDLLKACEEKAVINDKKYPAGKVKGNAKKYNQYDN